MAMRQYIGPRYVLKIYENSQDPQSAEWEANTSYEPLVMVNYNSSSYISRKDVPANVGNPVDNPEYWALSGLYNGQIANLQSQVTNIDTVEIPNLQTQINRMIPANRKVIILADSYGMRNTPNFCSILESSAPDTFMCNAETSIGYLTESNPHNFEQNLKRIYADEMTAEERAEITDIICCGGWNDAYRISAGTETASTLALAMLSFRNYAISQFPNAQLYSCFMAWQGYYNTQSGVTLDGMLTTQKIYNDFFRTGMGALQDVAYVMRWAEMFDDSYFHPNGDAGQYLAYALVQNLFSGSYHSLRKMTISRTDLRSAGTCTDMTLEVDQDNGLTKWSGTFTANGNASGTLKILWGFPYDKMPLVCPHNDGTNFIIPFTGKVNGSTYTGQLYMIMFGNGDVRAYKPDLTAVSSWEGRGYFNVMFNNTFCK